MRPQAGPALSLVPAAYLLLLREAPVPTDGAGRADRADRPGGRVCPESGLTRSASTARTEVLLQLRQGTGYMDGHWACGAAGHVEPGESVVATAAREAREETGAVVAFEDLEPLTTVHRSNAVGGAALEQRVDFFFTTRRWRGRLRLREATRAAALEWFPLSRLPAPVPPHELHVLRLLARALDDDVPVPAVTTFGFAPGQSVARYETPRSH